MEIRNQDLEMVINALQELHINPDTQSFMVDRRVRHSNNHFPTVKAVHDGASKICIEFHGLPFVVKWCTGTEDNEAMQEVKLYQEAISQRIEKFFPYTQYLVTINDVDFVIQEKIDFSVYNCPDNKRSQYTTQSRTVTPRIVAKIRKAYAKADNLDRFLDTLWIKMAVSLYGKTAVKTLCEFIAENGINDLHESNIGYKNNQPIILDFSGYHR